MNRTRTTQLVLVGALAVASACGDDDVSSGPSNASDVSDAAPAVPTAEPSPTEPQSTSPTTPDAPAPDTSAVRGDDDGTDTPTTLADDAWIDHVGSTCDRLLWDANAIVPNDGTPEGWTREIADHRALFEGDFFSSVEVPQAVQPTLDAIHTMRDEALEWLAEADTRVESGDLGSVLPALWEAQDRLLRLHSTWPMAGVRCALGYPSRVESADLTVLLEMNPWQITSGLGSIWVSQEWAGTVARLDPGTGDVIATIEVSATPVKAQPADGRLIVRTATTFDAIDPATNAVVASLLKSDVGPAANYGWAVDGALWICDGPRLHRYDPLTLAAVATIELGLDCNYTFATDDLAVAWNFNDDPGESGATVAAFVDPATNSVLATTDLPADVGGPAVFDDAVYFPGYLGEQAVVVDRATWTVSATPDMGAVGAGTGQAVWDDRAIYVVADGFYSTGDLGSVVAIDPSTWSPTGTIEPLEVNAVAVLDGALWSTSGSPFDVVQRHALQ